ncbi:MAG: gliding motility-associated C-terminal domain-containing protein, partial [Ferruginibacter sp.]
INPNTTPITSFSYTTPVCANGVNPTPILIPGFTTGGSFTAPAGVSINATTGIINLAASTPGTYSISYVLLTSGCQLAANNNTSITISPNTNAVTGFSYTTPVCANGSNQTPTLVAGFTTGGVFSSTAGLSINSSTGAINTVASTPGSYTVNYTVPASGCRLAGNNTANFVITANTTPVTNFTYTTPVCANGVNPTPNLALGFTSGGSFTAPSGLSVNATTGIINLAASTPGSYTVTYSIPVIGCQLAGSSNTPIVIAANTTPVTTFSYATPVCANGINPTPILPAGFTTGGSFTAPAGLSINPTTGVINLLTSTPGSYTVNYAVAVSGCQLAGNSNATIVINANTTPVTTFSYATPVCANAINPTPILGAGFTTGGSFTAPAGCSINATTGVINLATSTPGNYTITYNIAAVGCQLAASNTASITINPTITPVTNFSYTSPVCANGVNPIPTLTAGFTTGGNFTAPVGISINASTGVINLASSTPGTYSITYAIAATGCQLAGNNSASITINPTTTPVTGFSYASPFCSNAANPSPTLVAGFTTGGSFTAPAGLSINNGTGVINLGASTPGTYLVTYSVAASGCRLAGNNTSTIVINPTITPVTGFSYASPICANAANPSPTLVAGFTTGGSFTALAGIAVNATTGAINLATSTPGTYTITYNIAANGCQLSGSNTASITINPTITPITGFSYASPVCSNAANQTPVLSGGFTTGGTFSSTAGLSINPTTGIIDIAASTPGSYTITYSIAANGCMIAGNNTANIIINSVSTPVTLFSYATPVCANAGNQNPILDAAFTSGGIFTAPAGLSINSNTGVINASASTPGSYLVTYTINANGCRPSGTGTANILINPIPATPIALNQVRYCVNGITSQLTATGANLLWYNSATGGTGDPNAPIPSSATVGTTQYFVTQTLLGCESVRKPINVIINPLPSANAGPDQQILAGQSVTLQGSASGNNVTILWTPAFNITNPTSATPIVSPTSSFSYTINVTSADGCFNSDLVSVRVLRDIIIPNVFSPNGDGTNDKWIVKYIEDYPTAQVEIFNRYGQLLFQKSGYNNLNAWDGIYQGKPLPVGAYFYIIRLGDDRGPFSGSISIIR